MSHGSGSCGTVKDCWTLSFCQPHQGKPLNGEKDPESDKSKEEIPGVAKHQRVGAGEGGTSSEAQEGRRAWTFMNKEEGSGDKLCSSDRQSITGCKR